jgi:hypothetical protein
MALGNIIAEKSAISPDMALRLGKFFDNGAELWMGLQADVDLWNARARLKDDLAKIKPGCRSAGVKRYSNSSAMVSISLRTSVRCRRPSDGRKYSRSARSWRAAISSLASPVVAAA